MALLRTVALALVAPLVACATMAEGTGERVVVPIGTDAAAPSDQDRADAARRALAAAERAWRDGDALATFALANRALRNGPPDELLRPLRALRSRAREALVTGDIVRVRVQPRRDAVVNGQPVAVDVVFENLSAAHLRIPSQEAGSSIALVLFEIRRQDFDVFGNVSTSELTLQLPLDRDLDIGPGGRASVRGTIPASVTQFRHQGFSVIHVAGKFRPVVLRVGESEFFDALPLRGATIRVFLENYEHLAADPMGALGKSVAKRSPPHILTAAELVSPGDREEAIRMLQKAAREDPPLQRVLDAAISRLRSAGERPR